MGEIHATDTDKVAIVLMISVAIGMLVYNMRRLRTEPYRTLMFKGQVRLEEKELAKNKKKVHRKTMIMMEAKIKTCFKKNIKCYRKVRLRLLSCHRI